MFSISSLPKELIESVLRNVQLDEAMEFLHLNKHFRARVLKFGPLPRKIEQVEFVFNKYPKQGSFYRIFIDFHDCSIKFSQEGVISLRHGRMGPSESLQALSTRNSVKIVNNLIKECRSLKISLLGLQDGKELDRFFRNGEFLPNLSWVANSAVAGEMPYINYPLFHLSTKIDNICSINLIESFDDYPEAKIVQAFEKWVENPAFRNCQVIYPFGDFEYYFLALKKQNFSLLMKFEEDEVDFHKTIEKILKEGIPSGNPEPAAIIAHTYEDRYISFQERESKMSFKFEDLIRIIMRSTDIDILANDSNYSARLREYYFEKFSLEDEKFLVGLNESVFYRLHDSPYVENSFKFFKKRISPNIVCIFLVILEKDDNGEDFDRDDEDEDHDIVDSKFHLKLFAKSFNLNF